MSFLELYFREQEKYEKIYGPKTIVFMQNGKFYDSYNTKTRGHKNLDRLESLLNIKYIRRDDKYGNDITKPNQFGIPCVSISRNLTTLVDNGYTIVIFDQKTSNGENIERECVGVFSPGTYISDRQRLDANYIMGVYIAEEKQLNKNKCLMAVGVTIIDVTTGNSMIHEFCSSKDDEKFGMDELARMLQTFCPTEIIIYFHPVFLEEKTIKEIKSYLDLHKYSHCYFYTFYENRGNDSLNLLSKDTFKISYQNNYLSNIFDLNNQLTLNKKMSPIEILRLERKPYAIISLIIMLKYIGEHNVQLLRNLSHPTIYIYNDHLILGNNAIEQLNIIDSNNLEVYNQRFKSLFDVVNKTLTPMGRRFLKESLLNPLSQENKKVIIQRYDIIESLLQDNLFKKFQHQLKNIHDMERLHRRMAMGTIVPYEFYRLDTFYKATTQIITLIQDSPLLSNMIQEKIESVAKDFLLFQEEYRREFDLEKLQNYSNFAEVDHSFFKEGIYIKIDKIQRKINYVWSLIESINRYFVELLSPFCNKMNSKDLISIESNDKDGYYFTIARSKERILKSQLMKVGTIKINLQDDILEIHHNDIVFKQLKKGRTKIFITSITDHTSNLSQQTAKLAKLVKKKFITSMVNYYTKYKQTLHKISKFIAEIDFLVSGAVVAREYYYCKPRIPSMENVPSYLRARDLRHAIVERLCVETEYIPNDIELGNVPLKNNEECGKNGVLIFGINSAGKTVCMKSVGIAIILAQIGYYVPATEFEYEPYMALYARITGNDNLFKGLSSFALEMTELGAIISRTEKQGPSTLVIGDEICRGTERISGISIVASALVNLSNCNSSFIFSSHLHDLTKLEEIKKLKNLRIFHLRVEYDEEKDCLIFNRKLIPGPGPSIYGLMVAKYLIKCPNFVNRAEMIRRKLSGENGLNLPSRFSNYNKNLLVRNCQICNYCPTKSFHKELESHHIYFQKNCLEDGKIKEKPYLHKNGMYNLVILCRKCHLKVHRGDITIYGYSDTSIGPLLNYHVDFEKKLNNEIDNLLKLEQDILKRSW
ncbi:MAG: hypothetical protein QXW79_00725 [Thermoplasmata archaeon]